MLALWVFVCATFVHTVTCHTADHPTVHVQQVHLGLGRDQDITVSWSTPVGVSASSCVQYAPFAASPLNARDREILSQDVYSFSLNSCGYSETFVDGGTAKRAQVLHRVKLSDLQPGFSYAYQCGGPEGWSETFTFTARRTSQQFRQDALRLLVFGDMGLDNAQAWPDIQAEAGSSFYDAALSPGDFAYDLRDEDGRKGDEFMMSLQPLAASLPFLVSPGNHECHYNFSHYRQRFAMPGVHETENLYYSFNMGPAHIISYNTEVFFWPELFTQHHMRQQYEWLEADLAAANAARQDRPWIIVMGHRPMYCVAAGVAQRCDAEHEASRKGIPSACPLDAHLCDASPAANEVSFPVEDLFYKYGVDLAVYGHIHDYEHHYPVYDRKVFGDRNRQRHFNPMATVHVTSGAPGNTEMVQGDLEPPRGPCNASAPWCAFQSGYYPRNGQNADYSFSKVYIYNATHLQWIQWSSTLQEVVDEFWIEQHLHGGFREKLDRRKARKLVERGLLDYTDL